MSLSTTTNKSQYTGDNSTVEFDLAVKVLSEDHVVVSVKDTTDGTTATLVKGTGYTIAPISGDYDNGARVTTTATYTSDDEITLARIVPYTQILDLIDGGDLSAEGLENTMDRIVMLCQQLKEIFDRTITAPITDADGLTYEMPAVSNRTGKYCACDVSGNVVWVELATSSAVNSVATSAGLSLSGGILSCTVDGVTVEFDGATGKIKVKDGGIGATQLEDDLPYSVLADVTDARVLGNRSGGDTSAQEVPIVAVNATTKPLLIDDDNLTDDSDICGATQGSVKAYVDSQLGSLPISGSYFESAPQALSGSSTYAEAHLLGGRPLLIQAVLRCTTIDAGYAIGDEIIMPTMRDTSSKNFQMWSSTSQVGYVFTGTQNAPHKTTGTGTALTTSSWDIYLRAWK